MKKDRKETYLKHFIIGAFVVVALFLLMRFFTGCTTVLQTEEQPYRSLEYIHAVNSSLYGPNIRDWPVEEQEYFARAFERQVGR